MKAGGGWELMEKEDGPWLGRCQKSVCVCVCVCETLQLCCWPKPEEFGMATSSKQQRIKRKKVKLEKAKKGSIPNS